MYLGFRQYLFAKILTQETGCIEVYLPAQNLRELVFKGKEFKPGYESRFEFYEHIQVTVRSKVITQHGTKKCQLADVMLPAKCGNPLFRNFDSGARHIGIINQDFRCFYELFKKLGRYRPSLRQSTA